MAPELKLKPKRSKCRSRGAPLKVGAGLQLRRGALRPNRSDRKKVRFAGTFRVPPQPTRAGRKPLADWLAGWLAGLHNLHGRSMLTAQDENKSRPTLPAQPARRKRV